MRVKDAVSYNSYEAQMKRKKVKDLMDHMKCNKSQTYKNSIDIVHEIVFGRK